MSSSVIESQNVGGCVHCIAQEHATVDMSCMRGMDEKVHVPVNHDFHLKKAQSFFCVKRRSMDISGRRIEGAADVDGRRLDTMIVIHMNDD